MGNGEWGMENRKLSFSPNFLSLPSSPAFLLPHLPVGEFRLRSTTAESNQIFPHSLLPTHHSLIKTFMSITVTGKIERRDLGMGAWALVTDDGVTYEILKGADKNLLKAGQKAKIKGQVREDIMTTAMIGPVLEVKSFEVISSD